MVAEHDGGPYMVIGAATSLVFSLVINSLMLYALVKLPARYNFARSEKVFLMSLAVCGLGVGVFVGLPTFISALDVFHSAHASTWPSEFPPNQWCQAVGILGIIFMTSSSWFIALISINRCVIITRTFGSSITSSKRNLAAVQAIVWFTVTAFYVIMFVLVDAEVGLPDFTKVPVPRKNCTDHIEALEIIKQKEIRSALRHNFHLGVYHANVESHFHSKATFTTYDPFTAIACGPNWRQLPNYLYTAIVVFFVIPICCAIVSCCLMLRIAYRQVRSIRSIRIRPSVGSDESDNQPIAPVGRLMSPTRDFWLNQVTLAGGAIGLPNLAGENRRHSRKYSSRNPFRASSKFRTRSNKFFKHHKSTCSVLLILFVFLSTWSTYVVYFVVESKSYYNYVNDVFKANHSNHILVWEPEFSLRTSYTLTWLTVAFRNWSVVVFALLNRKFRHFAKRKFCSCLFQNCFVIRVKRFFKLRSNKVAPIFPRVSSHRILATNRSGMNLLGDFHAVIDRAQWTITDRS